MLEKLYNRKTAESGESTDRLGATRPSSFILVVGDHGEGLGEHHEDTHGIFLYDSTTHVPLFLKLPGGEKRGKQVSAQVRTTDILPTMVDLLGMAAPEHLDGQSLKAYFSGEAADRPAFGETDYPLRFGWASLRSIRDRGFKFIEAPRPEFYDLNRGFWRTRQPLCSLGCGRVEAAS